MFKEITKDNWLLFAQHNYDKPILNSEQEFYDDLKRFMYLKRLFNRYDKSGELSERLILNHLIVIFNVFGVKPALKMLEYQVEKKYWHVLKPFLIFLKHIHNNQYTDIGMDKEVIDRLRKI